MTSVLCCRNAIIRLTTQQRPASTCPRAASSGILKGVAGRVILLTTHYMDEAEQLCDRLIVVDKGRIMAEGSPASLIREHSSREVLEVRFGSDRNEQVAAQLTGVGDRIEVLPDRVLVYAHDGERALEEVTARDLHPRTSLVRRSSLEDVFLRLTGRSLIE